MNLEDKVLHIIHNILNVPAEKLSLQSSSENIEGWDSLKHMNLILALEEAFEVSLTDEEIIDMQNVEVIIRTIKGHL